MVCASFVRTTRRTVVNDDSRGGRPDASRSVPTFVRNVDALATQNPLGAWPGAQSIQIKRVYRLQTVPDAFRRPADPTPAGWGNLWATGRGSKSQSTAKPEQESDRAQAVLSSHPCTSCSRRLSGKPFHAPTFFPNAVAYPAGSSASAAEFLPCLWDYRDSSCQHILLHARGSLWSPCERMQTREPA
jgi:hypothetical protein